MKLVLRNNGLLLHIGVMAVLFQINQPLYLDCPLTYV